MTFWKRQCYSASMPSDHWLPETAWDERELSTKGSKENSGSDGNILNLPGGGRNMAIQILLNWMLKRDQFLLEVNDTSVNLI